MKTEEETKEKTPEEVARFFKKAYGAECYIEAVKSCVTAVKVGDFRFAKTLGEAAKILIKEGYHKEQPRRRSWFRRFRKVYELETNPRGLQAPEVD